MCGRLAQVVFLRIVLLTIASLVVCASAIQAQVASPVSDTQSASSQPEGKAAPGPDITLAELKFEGNLRLPQADQDRIAASIQQQGYSGALDGVVDEIQERARIGWQEYGYF